MKTEIRKGKEFEFLIYQPLYFFQAFRCFIFAFNVFVSGKKYRWSEKPLAFFLRISFPNAMRRFSFTENSVRPYKIGRSLDGLTTTSATMEFMGEIR